MPEVNVLFTSAGRRVELLRAFQAAYVTLGLRGSVLAADVDPLAPCLQVADKAYIVPRLDSSAYIPALAAICRREQVHLVFPLIDPDIPVLAANRQALEETGAKLGVVPFDAAQIAADKWLTRQFFASLDLKTPRSWLPTDVQPDLLEYPVFVKPRNGSAGKSAFRVNTPAELAFFLQYVPQAIVQELLPGPEITCDVIGDTTGELLGIACRQRIEVRSGEVAKGVTVYDPTIVAACVKIAQALPATGPITVQCMLRDGEAYFTEINARLGGGAPLAVAAGANFPAWLLARTAGLPLELPPLGSCQTGVYMTRHDESHFLCQHELEQVASRRL